MPGQPCMAYCTTCGDGKLDLDEECDDGNPVGGDGCSPTCKIESGFTCTTTTAQSTAATICQPVCGDGIVAGAEECDSGALFNTGDYGGCTSSCTYGPNCGDGVVQAAGGEECDLGSSNGLTSSCSSTCKILVLM
jgi:cysteine-rich repeat protein